MNTADHVIEDDSASDFVVRVSGESAGTVSTDTERPGRWVARDQYGSLMGRLRSREDGAEFLPSWFIAEASDWS